MTDAESAVAALRGPQHTLTISLQARALASSWPNPVLTDPVAEQLVDRLGLHSDMGGFSGGGTIIGTAVRSEIIDEQVRAFVTRYPRATVVTIGVGLCTRFARLSDLSVSWVDVDLPEVVAVREALLPTEGGPAGGDRTVVGASATDVEAMAALVRRFDRPVVVVLEGLSMYLTEDQVRALLGALAALPAGSRILLEALGTMAVRNAARNRQVAASGATFHWGIDDPAVLSSWDRRLRVDDVFYLMDRHHRRWPREYKLLRHVPLFRRQSKIVALTVVEPDR